MPLTSINERTVAAASCYLQFRRKKSSLTRVQEPGSRASERRGSLIFGIDDPIFAKALERICERL